ncbi:hypothetical protein NBRC111894_3498 [Sporolactobacillus inulinus]|uniref:Uncharacterized protein n=1 Tax=Sporolactobacillus inulinus TaxID=2078 RepID=A0A4Y1ZG91_9BACL|nr:hypothetical protein NBRC111894_3498 [Sporolactobacillus inulinus]
MRHINCRCLQSPNTPHQAITLILHFNPPCLILRFAHFFITLDRALHILFYIF